MKVNYDFKQLNDMDNIAGFTSELHSNLNKVLNEYDKKLKTNVIDKLETIRYQITEAGNSTLKLALHYLITGYNEGNEKKVQHGFNKAKEVDCNIEIKVEEPRKIKPKKRPRIEQDEIRMVISHTVNVKITKTETLYEL